jgi:type II secretory pathway pseudopilin PulG
MQTIAQRRRAVDGAARPAACRAFTLVELVTAASLMTIMMIGVVQIFGVITQTAGQAEGLSFAQQQARVILDNLNRDLRGMTREGYLTITHNTIAPVSGVDGRFYCTNTPNALLPTDTNKTPDPESVYFCDTLAFVTIGRFSSTWNTVTDPTTNQKKGSPGGAAEVVYTNYVQTSDLVLRATTADVTSSTSPMNPRKGLLARGMWLWSNDPRSGREEQDGQDKPDWDSLSEMFARQDGGRGAGNKISAPGSTTQPHVALPWVTVWPWKPDDASSGSTTNLPSLRHVLASCVSEFYVEVFNPDGDDDYPFPPRSFTDARNWRMGPPGLLGINTTETYRWAAPVTNPANLRPLGTWPRAIRVTVAIHDPSDTRPLKPGKRAEGYGFQETYWITDP